MLKMRGVASLCLLITVFTASQVYGLNIAQTKHLDDNFDSMKNLCNPNQRGNVIRIYNGLKT
jgi:hypothetical protein